MFRHMRKHFTPGTRRSSLNYRGLIVPIDTNLIPRPVVKQLRANAYEQPEINAAMSLVRDGDSILELGTGLGIVSGLVAKAFPNAMISSFEANPNLLPAIGTLHKLNGIHNVFVENVILLPNPKSSVHLIHLHRYFPETSIRESNATVGHVEVPLRDVNFEISRVKPQILICDIEGAEANLVDGLDMASLRAAIVEIHPNMLSDNDIKLIFDRFIGAGLYPDITLSDKLVVAFRRMV